MSDLETLASDIDGVKQLIENLEHCPEEERPQRETAVLYAAWGVYSGVKDRYCAHPILVHQQRKAPPENATAEWFYLESKAMFDALANTPSPGVEYS